MFIATPWDADRRFRDPHTRTLTPASPASPGWTRGHRQSPLRWPFLCPGFPAYGAIGAASILPLGAALIFGPLLSTGFGTTVEPPLTDGAALSCRRSRCRRM